MPTRYASGFAVMLAVTIMATGACGTRDKRARGEDLLKQTSARIASAQALSVTTDETNDRVARDGKTRQVHLQRLVTVRRPDRMWFKTSGDRNTEGFYDGSRLTLLFHGEKVFGIIPTPATLDDTIQTVSERYDIPLPIGDLLTSDPQKSYLSSQTTGGWEGEDTIDGKTCARVEWHHPNVDWTIWIPESGEPLPAKLWVNYKSRDRKTTVLFKDWNLSPRLSDAMFQAPTPDDYEGVAVIQRASAVLPPDAKPDAPPASDVTPAPPK
ncbi:MAG TPA: DUF2092 domain-containing protein [Vicinamibacterales bacterium]